MTVWRGGREDLHCYDRIRAGPIVDYHLLAPHLRELLAQQTSHDVISAASGESRDKSHRLTRECLRNSMTDRRENSKGRSFYGHIFSDLSAHVCPYSKVLNCNRKLR